MKEEKKEQWRVLTVATNNLKKQAFGLQCRIEGVIAQQQEMMQREEIANSEKLQILKFWRSSLANVRVVLTEQEDKEDIEIVFPEMVKLEGKKSRIQYLEVEQIFEFSLKVKQEVRFLEPFLPQSTYNKKLLTDDLIQAIETFEMAALNYIL